MISKSIITALLVITLCCFGAEAPSAFGPVLSGQVVLSGSRDLSGYEVELSGLDIANAPSSRISLMPDGSFEMHGLSPGSYNLHVRDKTGRVVHIEPVMVGRRSASVRINVLQKQPQPMPQGRISLARLRHKAPREARKELAAALKLSARKDFQGAIVRLQKAIAIDPEYVEAHNNLGVAYIHAGELQKAIESFHAALALDPDSVKVNANLSYVLVRLGLDRDAERAARSALRSDPANPHANYFLALALLRQGKANGEARLCLQAAAPLIPHARQLARQAFGGTQP